MLYRIQTEGLTYLFDSEITYIDSVNDNEFKIREVSDPSSGQLTIQYINDNLITDIPVERIKDIADYIDNNDNKENENDYNNKKKIPYIFHQGKKIYFNKLDQKLIKEDKVVNVIKFAGDGLVIAEDNEGNQEKYNPLEDFDNFKNFADVTARRQKSGNRSKRSPSVSFMHEGNSYDAIIYPNRRFTSVIIDGNEIRGEIIGSSHDTFDFRKSGDKSIIKISLSDLTNCDEIKAKAISFFNKKNTIDIENKNYKSSSVTGNKSYKEVLSSTSSSSKSASISNISDMNLNNDLAKDLEKLESKRSRLEKELLLEENELLKKYLAPK